MGLEYFILQASVWVYTDRMVENKNGCHMIMIYSLLFGFIQMTTSATCSDPTSLVNSAAILNPPLPEFLAIQSSKMALVLQMSHAVTCLLLLYRRVRWFVPNGTIQ